jgi:hypothetical protein
MEAPTARPQRSDSRRSTIFDRAFPFLFVAWVAASLVLWWRSGGFDGETGIEGVLELGYIGFYAAIPFSLVCTALFLLDEWREKRWAWRELDERLSARSGRGRSSGARMAARRRGKVG